MITFSDFQSINNEVEVAVSEAFDTMKTKSPMDYILFLAMVIIEKNMIIQIQKYFHM